MDWATPFPIALRPHIGPPRWSAVWLWLALTALLSCSAPASADPLRERETAIRAAFVYRLAFFVTWPGDVLPSADSDIVVCVVGPQPSSLFLRLSDESRERRIRERGMQVRALPDGASLDGCHIAYVEGDSGAKANDSHVVVVESVDRLDDIGTLALVPMAGEGTEVRLGFIADRERSTRGRFTFNAQLLQLLRFRDAPRGSGQ